MVHISFEKQLLKDICIFIYQNDICIFLVDMKLAFKFINTYSMIKLLHYFYDLFGSLEREESRGEESRGK